MFLDQTLVCSAFNNTIDWFPQQLSSCIGMCCLTVTFERSKTSEIFNIFLFLLLLQLRTDVS